MFLLNFKILGKVVPEKSLTKNFNIHYIGERDRNQRTNGPVNAHLISVPTVSTKNSKIGQGQPRVIIYINIVELETQCYMPSFKIIGLLVQEKKIFNCFDHIWTWRPSW